MSNHYQSQPRKVKGSAGAGEWLPPTVGRKWFDQGKFANPYEATPSTDVPVPPVSAPPPVPADTGKQGTDVPPLVAEVKVGRSTVRFYAPDPHTKELLENGDLNVYEAINTGRAFPSTTTVIGALDKPALPPWAAGVAADYGENVLRELQDMSNEERDMRLAQELAVADRRTGRTQFRKEAGSAHRKQGDSAAARGTEVHAYAEAIARGETPDVPEELRGYVQAVQNFHTAVPNIEFLYTEATLYNEDAHTMGTIDAIVKIGDKTYVMDYKTNKKATVYSSVGMQLSGSANSKEIVFADGSRTPMPKIDGGLGVGLGPDGTMNIFHFETEPDGPHHRGFKAARDAWEWKFRAGKDPRPINPADLG